MLHLSCPPLLFDSFAPVDDIQSCRIFMCRINSHLNNYSIHQIMEKTKATTIEAYISAFPESTQVLLRQLQQAIKDLVPEAEEKISYEIPTFTLAGNLVHFAAYKNHIGFYPGSSGIKNFTAELSAYHTSKGTVQFPISQPLPLELIKRIVQFRVKENLEKKSKKSTRGQQ